MRGAKVDIPREVVGDVLVRLAIAAATLRKLPCQCAEPSPIYLEAHQAPRTTSSACGCWALLVIQLVAQVTLNETATATLGNHGPYARLRCPAMSRSVSMLN
jgi:hypothetical protein